MRTTIKIELRTELFIKALEQLDKVNKLPSNVELARILGIKSKSTITEIKARRQNIQPDKWELFKKHFNKYLPDNSVPRETGDGSNQHVNDIDAAMAYAKTDPLRNRSGAEWAVMRLLRHELASLRAEATKRGFQDCMDELNDKIRAVLQQ